MSGIGGYEGESMGYRCYLFYMNGGAIKKFHGWSEPLRIRYKQCGAAYEITSEMFEESVKHDYFSVVKKFVESR